MRCVPFAILEHTTADGVHYDLLIQDARTIPQDSGQGLPDPDDRLSLWAARVPQHPEDWLALGRLTMTPLPHHRARYLHYEGPISRGRGSVRRLAGGHLQVLAWGDQAKKIRLPLDRAWAVISLATGPTQAIEAVVTPDKA